MLNRLPFITALTRFCLPAGNFSTQYPLHQTARLTGIRNYGCYNPAVIATYNTPEQFEKIKGNLATASISKN